MTYLLLSIGLFFMLGLPVLLTVVPWIATLSRQAPVAFLILILLGVALTLFVALGASAVNFKLASAKIRRRTFNVFATSEEDRIVIER